MGQDYQHQSHGHCVERLFVIVEIDQEAMKNLQKIFIELLINLIDLLRQ